ncbi:MAG: hypothetical protein ACFFDF_07605 [Candidatus Odinarchaeota archaeon]
MAIRINLGKKVLDYNSGLMTENLSLDSLKYNVLISCNDQTERISLISLILNQIYNKASNIGVLLIKLNSSEGKDLYHLDKVYEYGDLDLEIPYFFGNQLSEVQKEHFERTINAIFGFHFEISIVISCLLIQYKNGKFPSSIIDFLEDLINYLKEHPYHEEFNNSNIRSIEEAINFIQKNPVLESTLGLSFDIPQWLALWYEGRKICIDLSDCDLRYQRILVPLLLQAVKNCVPIKDSDTPVGIVVLEDCDDFLQKVPFEVYKNNFKINREYYHQIEEMAYFLTKEQLIEVFGDKDYLLNVQLESVFHRLIFDELIYRNISFIATCINTSNLHYQYRTQFQIRLNLD